MRIEREVPIEKVWINLYPRPIGYYLGGDTHLHNLAIDMREKGQLEAIAVEVVCNSFDDDEDAEIYLIHGGIRRYLAARLLGWTTIRAYWIL